MLAINALWRASQVATDVFDDASAAHLGINRTDHRAIDVLDQEGPMTAGELAERTRLSPAATTTAIDRLEAKGYARRFPSPDDRRRVLVEITAKAQRRGAEVYVPMGEKSAELMGRYSIAELEVIEDFLRRGAELSAEQLERVLAMKSTRSAK